MQGLATGGGYIGTVQCHTNSCHLCCGFGTKVKKILVFMQLAL